MVPPMKGVVGALGRELYFFEALPALHAGGAEDTGRTDRPKATVPVPSPPGSAHFHPDVGGETGHPVSCGWN